MTLDKLYEQIKNVEAYLALAVERCRTKRQAELQRQLRGLRLQQLAMEARATKAARRAA